MASYIVKNEATAVIITFKLPGVHDGGGLVLELLDAARLRLSSDDSDPTSGRAAPLSLSVPLPPCGEDWISKTQRGRGGGYESNFSAKFSKRRGELKVTLPKPRSFKPGSHNQGCSVGSAPVAPVSGRAPSSQAPSSQVLVQGAAASPGCASPGPRAAVLPDPASPGADPSGAGEQKEGAQPLSLEGSRLEELSLEGLSLQDQLVAEAARAQKGADNPTNSPGGKARDHDEEEPPRAAFAWEMPLHSGGAGGGLRRSSDQLFELARASLDGKAMQRLSEGVLEWTSLRGSKEPSDAPRVAAAVLGQCCAQAGTAEGARALATHLASSFLKATKQQRVHNQPHCFPSPQFSFSPPPILLLPLPLPNRNHNNPRPPILPQSSAD
mmetsp:Transcript_41326/g.93096  ORF Transcript_41326/g.93096 Transcript_41326/m.93096 type:complete len:382 (-) Transcript_41326:679-1824(-)